MRTRKEIKESAKTLLKRNIFSSEWLFVLIGLLLIALITSVTSSFIIGLIFMGVFAIGSSRFVLDFARRKDEQPNITKIFSGFTDNNLGDNIILGILQWLYIFLWSLLFFIPGIVKSYAYSMAYYIKIDHPEMDANQCITESRKLMKGHKWQLFVLDLSFIGWYIVGMLCLGIGTLWVEPYHELSKAEFYRSLIGESVDAEAK